MFLVTEKEYFRTRVCKRLSCGFPFCNGIETLTPLPTASDRAFVRVDKL